MSKYIIDVGDAYTKHICGKGDMLCLPIRINEFENNWLNTNIPLTPYTEPDTEKVREEAYAEGFKDGQCAERNGLVANYEQERETIQVGDVVRVKNAPEVEIWVTDISDEDGGLLSGLALKTVDDNCDMGDTYANRNMYNFERTGKHYDVPTVLEKMRGEQDG